MDEQTIDFDIQDNMIELDIAGNSSSLNRGTLVLLWMCSWYFERVEQIM